MDDMRAMMQDELRQALSGLLLPAAAIPTAPTIPSTSDVLPTIIPIDNSKGQPSNVVKVVPIMQIKKKNLRNVRKKNYPTGGTQQGNVSRVMEVHAIQQPRRFSNFNQPLSKVLECII